MKLTNRELQALLDRCEQHTGVRRSKVLERAMEKIRRELGGNMKLKAVTLRDLDTFVGMDGLTKQTLKSFVSQEEDVITPNGARLRCYMIGRRVCADAFKGDDSVRYVG